MIEVRDFDLVFSGGSVAAKLLIRQQCGSQTIGDHHLIFVFNFVAMEAARVSGSMRAQLRIIDFFHMLHVPLIERESYCPFYQSLITDYFREVDFAIVDSESYFEERGIVPSFSGAKLVCERRAVSGEQEEMLSGRNNVDQIYL